MKILSRYLASSFVFPFLGSTLFFIGFLLVFQLFKFMRMLTQKEIPWEEALSLLGYMAVTLLPFSMPMAAFFATIFVVSKMSNDSEILAMRSFGWGKRKLYTPFFLLSLLVAVALFALQGSIIPNAKTIFRNTVIRLTSSGMLSSITPGTFFTEIPGVMLFVSEISEEQSRLKNIFIHEQKEGQGIKVIFAEEGGLVKREGGRWGLPSVRLFLFRGNMVTIGPGGQVKKILFEEYDFPITRQGQHIFLSSRISMKHNRQLRQDMKTQKGPELTRLKMEYFGRWNTSIQCVLFVFLGFLFGMRRHRRGHRPNDSKGALTLIFYYAVFFGLGSFAKKGQVPVGVAIFGPTLLWGALGAWPLRKLNWD